MLLPPPSTTVSNSIPVTTSKRNKNERAMVIWLLFLNPFTSALYHNQCCFI